MLVDIPDLGRAGTKLPALVEENLSFIISLKEVPLSDITCNGHGVWKNDGVRPLVYKKDNEGKYKQISYKNILKNKWKKITLHLLGPISIKRIVPT